MGATILLADDSITIQKVIELTFAETEHRVVAVGSGRDLLDRVGTLKPDAVLCDVVMPDMNGYDICQTLKSDPATLHIPVVLLTGTFEPFDRSRALAAGCDAIVTKPFEAEELIRTVEELLRRKPQAGTTVPIGLEAVGVPEGVPALDFTTTGFERMGVKETAYEPGIPDEGLEFSSTGVVAPLPAAPPVTADIFALTETTPPRSTSEEELPAAQELEAGAVEDETFPSAPQGLRQDHEAAFAPVAEPEVDDDRFPSEEVAQAAPAEVAAPEAIAEPVAATGPEFPKESVAASVAVVPPRWSGNLSDEDVERIAQRVLELATPLLERIAWEVIPDMAEMLVRKRIRELEEAAEQEA